MKTIFNLRSQPHHSLCLLMALLFTTFFTNTTARAQSAITNVYSHRAAAAVQTVYTGTGATGNAASGFTGTTYTYQYGQSVATNNNALLLDSFAALGVNFHYQTAHLVTIFRRVNNATVTGLRKSLWFEQSAATTVSHTVPARLLPDYDDSLERIFSKGNVLNIGMDNNFQNSSTTNNNNIERVDYMIPFGVKAPDGTKAGFAVFDRGSGTSHDTFYIAAVRTIDGSGNPTSYYNAVRVLPTNYGNGVVSAINYLILRENPGDPGLLLMNNTVSQNLDGTFLRFSDLSVPNNTTIYGYSLFAPDVNVSPATNLVDYTNATNFPTSTDLSGGGLDQVAIAGVWVTTATAVVLSEKIANFTAVKDNDNKVTLSWTMGITDGMKELVIERSPDGKSFAPLLHLYNLSSGEQSAIDDRPLPGDNFYRLMLVDADNHAAAYSPIGIIATSTPNTFVNLNIFPNPSANRTLTLHATGLKNETYDVRVFSLGGLVITHQQVIGAATLSKDLLLPQNLPSGAYTLLLTDSRGNKVFTKTILLR